jgi:hypothetical protein
MKKEIVEKKHKKAERKEDVEEEGEENKRRKQRKRKNMTNTVITFMSPHTFTLIFNTVQPVLKMQNVQLKLSLCFSFKRAPRHEGVLGDCRYCSTYSLTWR